ncbi:hypothetical protein BDF22DRAFT_678519 [Syncephalis plumigaleata]|nr:hypothetical protein BDF22DRAFT_678519 [Syncephalis plumigaleata]
MCNYLPLSFILLRISFSPSLSLSLSLSMIIISSHFLLSSVFSFNDILTFPYFILAYLSYNPCDIYIYTASCIRTVCSIVFLVVDDDNIVCTIGFPAS